MIRKAFGINPESLSDDEWAKLVNEYNFVRELELKSIENVIKSALAEVLNKAFGNNE